MKKNAVILAGGQGSRLWPVSRRDYPKQFIEFFGGKSLLQITLLRTLKDFSPARIFILTSQSYYYNVLGQIENCREIKSAAKRALARNIFLEPAARSTLGAVLLLFKLHSGKEKEVFFVFPSDHIIKPQSKLSSALKEALALAKEGKIVVFGITPQKPSTDYGYIVPQQKAKDVFAVKRFVEKPSLYQAKALLKKGAFWNAGIFCFSQEAFLAELKKASPSFYKFYQKDKESFLKKFSSLPALSLDYGLMEKTKQSWGVKLKVFWSDLGSWDSLFEFLAKEKQKPLVKKFWGASNVSVWSEKLVVLAGVKNLMAIESPDALLLLKKGESFRLKQIVENLKKTDSAFLENKVKVWRKWGYYVVLQAGKNYKVKEICVYPRRCLSLQKHKYRSEHWNVVEGEAEVILGRCKFAIKKNQSLFVKVGQKHKLCNPKDKYLRIIEVQIGSYLEEDDIKRFD